MQDEGSRTAAFQPFCIVKQNASPEIFFSLGIQDVCVGSIRLQLDGARFLFFRDMGSYDEVATHRCFVREWGYWIWNTTILRHVLSEK